MRDIDAVVDWIGDRTGQPNVALVGWATHYLFNDRPERGRTRFIQEVLSFLKNEASISSPPVTDDLMKYF